MKKIFTIRGWRYEPEDGDLVVHKNDRVNLKDCSTESARFICNGRDYFVRKQEGKSSFGLWMRDELVNESISCNAVLPKFNPENPEDTNKFLEHIAKFGLILYDESEQSA